MQKNFSFFLLLIVILLGACKVDMICPAYQSYFIHDEEARRKMFSYMAEDSLPRRDSRTMAKNQDGIAEGEWYWARNRTMRSVDMEMVIAVENDSVKFQGDDLMFAEADVIDSVALDSARMVAQGFQYNLDQKFYNWYFHDKLVWKDELYPPDKKDKMLSSDDNTEKKGFFKRLFGGKNKDSEEGDLETEEPAEGETEGKKEKRIKKKNKPPKEKKVKNEVIEEEDEEIEVAPPAEENDDGF